MIKKIQHPKPTIEQYEEIIKCMKDPMYFIQKYFHIISPVNGVVKYEIINGHKEILKSIFDKQDTIVLGPRQHGKTTIVMGMMLWMLCFQQNKSICIASFTHSNSVRIMLEIQSKYENLPLWIKPELEECSRNCISAKNYVELTTLSLGSPVAYWTGRSYDVVWIEELQFVKPESLLKLFNSYDFQGRLLHNTQTILTSSAGDFGSFFQWFWEDANNGYNSFTPIEIKREERIISKKDKKYFIEKYGCERFSRDFENKFLIPYDQTSGEFVTEPNLKQLWKWNCIKDEYRKGIFKNIFRS